jgi:bifunctional non-homologous end joining protein LigD
MPAKAETLLKDYRAKRDFAKTREPSGAARRKKAAKQGIFVVQKHDATRLHYDFRLELDGVLKSWAVTKGPSLNPADKRLAVHVEDHPLDYATFEGTIPEGQYGGGTVMLWDEGTWEPIGDPHKGLKDGDLKFRLNGKRMHGEWVLVHMKGRDTQRRKGPARENWLLIKHRDEYASDDGESLIEDNVTSVETGRDLDGIAKGLKSKKAPAKPKVWTHGKAVALPEFRPPQLATLVDEVPQGSNWVFEMKYDGYRCLAAIAGQEVRLYTRNGNDWTTQFGAIREPLAELTAGSALIDGEICAFNAAGKTDFSTLKDALSTGDPLVYFAFDLLEQDGESLEDLPLVERKERLKKLLGPVERDAPVQFSEHVRGNGQKVYDALCKGGFEGLIAKRADEPYAHERSKGWLKVKCVKRQEFVIGGWRPSTKRNRFASLLLGTYDDGKFVYHGRVGTGFNEDDAAALQKALDKRARKTKPFDEVPRDIARVANWVEPELVAEIAFSEVTPDNVLRHPSFMGLREDKDPKSVTFEQPADTEKVAKSSQPAAKGERVHFDWHKGVDVAERLKVHLTTPERVAYPGQGVTKGELVAYYEAVADAMLPFLKDRPLSLVRCPQGSNKSCFFQKHDSGGFPDEIRKVPITEKDGETEDYLYVADLAGIVAAVQMNTLEFHIWGSRRDRIEVPERIIFDIDPDEGLDFEEVRRAAFDMRDALEELGLTTFPMVTGGKGIHVIAPLKRQAEWPEVKAFCKGFAQQLADAEPDRFVANMSKAKRKGRMFIDYLRNERGSTAICPYSTRSRDKAPVATPVTWDELKTLAGANVFSLAEAAERAKGSDPWPGYAKAGKAITAKMLEAVEAEI